MKTEELTNTALNWTVAKANGNTVGFINTCNVRQPCIWVPSYEGDIDLPLPEYVTKWEHGGPIIEQEKISFVEVSSRNEWVASVPQPNMIGWRILGYGSTQLIAAMRCFVKLKLGDDVSLPKELF